MKIFRFTRVASALIGGADRHTSVWLSLVGELTFRELKSLPITSNKKTTPLRVLLFYWRIELDYSRFTRVASALIGGADRHTSVWLSLVGELTFRELKSLPITSNKKTTPLRVLLFYWRIDREMRTKIRYAAEIFFLCLQKNLSYLFAVIYCCITISFLP